MKTMCKAYLATLLLTATAPIVVLAEELRSDYFYVGLDLGASIPAAKFFRDQETDTISRITKSKMFGASIGYSFYPGMMIEFAMTHQPSYDFSYEIPMKELDSTSHGNINAKIESFFGNLVYQMPAKAFGLKPYIMAGLGIARLRTTPVVINYPGTTIPIFTMDRTKGKYFTYHVGGGVTRDISKHLEVDFGLKLQIIQGVKFKYKAINRITFDLETGSKKKTLLAGQFTIGLKVNL
jgi:opacity protein-like surface antigen